METFIHDELATQESLLTPEQVDQKWSEIVEDLSGTLAPDSEEFKETVNAMAANRKRNGNLDSTTQQGQGSPEPGV